MEDQKLAFLKAKAIQLAENALSTGKALVKLAEESKRLKRKRVKRYDKTRANKKAWVTLRTSMITYMAAARHAAILAAPMPRFPEGGVPIEHGMASFGESGPERIQDYRNRELKEEPFLAINRFKKEDLEQRIKYINHKNNLDNAEGEEKTVEL